MEDLLLLLETSGEHCSVAVAMLEGTTQRVLAKAEHLIAMQHTAMLLPLIKEAFAKTSFKLQDTSAVIVSTGPGSYTALRAGYSSAKGLCSALGIPMIEVSTLRGLASTALSAEGDFGGDVVAVLPARRQDVYCARSSADLKVLTAPICVEANETWWNEQFGASPTMLVGPSAQGLCEQHERKERAVDVTLSAEHLLVLGAEKYRDRAFADAASVEPNYVKPPFITKAKPRFGQK